MLQTNITGMFVEFSQFLDHTELAPIHGTFAFPVYNAQAPGCSAGELSKEPLDCVHFPGLTCSGSGSWVLHKDTDSVGPEFVPFPGPRSSDDQRLGECMIPGLWCVLSPPWSWLLSFLGTYSQSVS